MRQYTRKIARLLTVAFVLSAFTPLLLCGGSSFTKAEASDCCRAMDFKCHKNDGNGACCQHQSVAPLNLAITSALKLAPPQPLATIGLLPVVATGGVLGSQSCHQVFDFLPGHSPPGTVPLFLFHSTLLI
jgi:hypothetical protein